MLLVMRESCKHCDTLLLQRQQEIRSRPHKTAKERPTMQLIEDRRKAQAGRKRGSGWIAGATQWGAKTKCRHVPVW
jgi:hypothetical protein